MKKWYVVQVFTGFEDIVRISLQRRIEDEGLQDQFGEIVVPAGEIISKFTDEEVSKEKIFPGYLLINMEMTAETRRMVCNTSRITRFLGGESPMPLSNKEVERIFNQMSGGLSASSDQESLAIGNEVHIVDGPFSGYMGIVEQLDDEHERATVMVSIFGRMTPIELGFDQVKR